MKLKKGISFIAVLLVLLMVFSFASCTKSETEASSETVTQESDTTEETTKSEAEEEVVDENKRTDLNVRVGESFSTFDPNNYVYGLDLMISSNVYEALYTVNSDMEEIPVLATGYELSEDGLTIVFKVSDDIYFSNGDLLTVNDVRCSVERAKASAYLSTVFEFIDSVSVDEDVNTVTLNMNTPKPNLIPIIAGLFIVNESYAEENQDESGLLGFNTCGTGPYLVDGYTLDESVTLKSNPDYRLGAAAIETINYTLITDQNTTYNAVKSGDIDLAYHVDTPNWADLLADENISTDSQEYNHSSYLVLNVNAEPFDNKLVRQALACAINRDDIATMAMDGMAYPAYSLTSPLMFGYVETDPMFTYDVKRAKELLAEAGYPDGIDIGEFQTLAGTYLEDAAEVVQQQLAEAGITCTLSSMDPNTVVTNAFTGNFTMLTMGMSNMYDISAVNIYYSSKNLGSLNMSQYSNAEMDVLLDEAEVCMDEETRAEMYKEILAKVDEETAYVFLFSKIQCTAWSSDLDYEHEPTDYKLYKASWK